MPYKTTKEQRQTIAAEYRAGLSIANIALKYNLSEATIYHYLRNAGVKFRFRNGKDILWKPTLSYDLLYQLYHVEKKSLNDIALEYGLPNSQTVKKEMKYYGIDRRSYSDAGVNLYKTKPETKTKILDGMYKASSKWLQHNKPTSIEKAFMEWAGQNSLFYIFQYTIPNCSLYHRFDFNIIDTKILIEIDGDYWHSSAEAIKRDKMYDDIAKKHGYIVIRIKEHEIEENKNIFVEKLSQFIR